MLKILPSLKQIVQMEQMPIDLVSIYTVMQIYYQYYGYAAQAENNTTVTCNWERPKKFIKDLHPLSLIVK